MSIKKLHPESLMMSLGYHPEWSEGAIKPPIFQTSTFAFKNAETGKEFFKNKGNSSIKSNGLIYSRINNPNLEIAEQRLALWENAEESALFESGMAAISTTMLQLLKPGDVVLHTQPLYGGTHSFFYSFLTKMNIEVIPYEEDESSEIKIEKIVLKKEYHNRIKLIYIESPSNPTNKLSSFDYAVNWAKKLSSTDQQVITVADNTYMGPLWQQPLQHGIDLVVYSATKYLSGHSDLIAGAVIGSKEKIKPIKTLRTLLGGMAGPHTAWLLTRSLETLKLRMDKQAENAQKIASFLTTHANITKLHYLGNLESENQQQAIFKKQCLNSGAMIAFDVKGGEKEAFQFLNNLKLIHLAVSLGSTESLAEHPFSMTHSDVPPEIKLKYGILESTIRLSVGIEHHEDIIADLNQALNSI
jgi:methionine-gamma-lyase